MAPAIVALLVFGAAVVGTTPRAWTPFGGGAGSDDVWARTPASTAHAISDLQIAMATRLPTADPVGAGVIVAAAWAAIAASGLTAALRHAGLGVGSAALLALVAAAAPLASWQAGSPLGAAPLTAVSAAVLLTIVGRFPSAHEHRRLLRAALLGLAVVTVAAAAAGTDLRLVAGRVRADLGWIGLVLLAANVLRHPQRPGLVVPVAVVAFAILLLTAPLGVPARVALLLPWLWWLAGTGLSEVLAWRRPAASRWALAGLLAWLAMHLASVPWNERRRESALVRTWADGVVAATTARTSVVTTGSAGGRLVAALLDPRRPASSRIVAPQDASAAIDRHGPVLVPEAPVQAALRWRGVGLAAMTGPIGVPLERIIESQPAGTIVVAAISRDAARSLTAAQWRALGGLGLRLADAGQPRAHAVVGVTGARVEALDAAHPDHVRLDVQPGDPLGRTGTRAPIDARVEADAARARVTLRGRPFADVSGVAVLLFTTRGTLVGWRHGADASRLHGAPLGPRDDGASLAVAALPCLDLAAGVEADVTRLARHGALGVHTHAATAVDLHVEVAPSEPDAAVEARSAALRGSSLIEAAGSARLEHPAPGHLRVVTDVSGSVGVRLHGHASSARARASAPTRLCAAWPVPQAIIPARTQALVAVSPDTDVLFDEGWHHRERDGAGEFRWMAGRRSTVLLVVGESRTVRLMVQARPVTTPGAADTVGLLVNGRDLGDRALQRGEAAYAWDVPADALAPGTNRIVVTTSLARRPADLGSGGDRRVLGLAVRAWLVAEPSTPGVSADR